MPESLHIGPHAFRSTIEKERSIKPVSSYLAFQLSWVFTICVIAIWSCPDFQWDIHISANAHFHRVIVLAVEALEQVLFFGLYFFVYYIAHPLFRLLVDITMCLDPISCVI